MSAADHDAPGTASMGKLDDAFRDILRRWHGATMTADQYGAHLVHIPAMSVFGYNRPSTWVEFTLPVGFPLACPADFKTDGALRLASGALPSHTDFPERRDYIHWYHRLMYWDANRDSIINYVGSIIRRLKSAAEVQSHD